MSPNEVAKLRCRVGMDKWMWLGRLAPKRMAMG